MVPITERTEKSCTFDENVKLYLKNGERVRQRELPEPKVENGAQAKRSRFDGIRYFHVLRRIFFLVIIEITTRIIAKLN